MNAAKAITIAVLLAGVLFALPACAPSAEKDAGRLIGVEWKLLSSSTKSANLGSFGITARFNDTKVAGFSGVNQYGGPYTTEKDGSFTVGEVVSTLMAGEPTAMEAERVYLALLATCDRYQVADGKLTLYTGDEESLVFEEAKAVELPGTSWIVTGYNNGKQAVVSVALDSTMTIEFSVDQTVSGSSGVNTYNGAFKVDGQALDMGPFATTRMAGPTELMAQETAFLAAMDNATTWTVERGSLEIRDSAGALQVTASEAP